MGADVRFDLRGLQAALDLVGDQPRSLGDIARAFDAEGYKADLTKALRLMSMRLCALKRLRLVKKQKIAGREMWRRDEEGSVLA